MKKQIVIVCLMTTFHTCSGMFAPVKPVQGQRAQQSVSRAASRAAGDEKKTALPVLMPKPVVMLHDVSTQLREKFKDFFEVYKLSSEYAHLPYQEKRSYQSKIDKQAATLVGLISRTSNDVLRNMGESKKNVFLATLEQGIREKITQDDVFTFVVSTVCKYDKKAASARAINDRASWTSHHG